MHASPTKTPPRRPTAAVGKSPPLSSPRAFAPNPMHLPFAHSLPFVHSLPTHSQLLTPSPLRSTTADGPRYCYHPTCLDTSGRPKRPEPYSRKADLKRHVESTHEKRFLDCTFKRCDRRGENGFTRKDHRTEHLRGYHRMGIPKRENGGGGRGEGREEDWGRERGLTEGTGGLKRGREREFR